MTSSWVVEKGLGDAMKVLAANKFHFVKGGAERYFFELTRILEGRGHTVVPFAMQHEQNEPSEFDRLLRLERGFDGERGLRGSRQSVPRVSTRARRGGR